MNRLDSLFLNEVGGVRAGWSGLPAALRRRKLLCSREMSVELNSIFLFFLSWLARCSCCPRTCISGGTGLSPAPGTSPPGPGPPPAPPARRRWWSPGWTSPPRDWSQRVHSPPYSQQSVNVLGMKIWTPSQESFNYQGIAWLCVLLHGLPFCTVLSADNFQLNVTKLQSSLSSVDCMD